MENWRVNDGFRLRGGGDFYSIEGRSFCRTKKSCHYYFAYKKGKRFLDLERR